MSASTKPTGQFTTKLYTEDLGGQKVRLTKPLVYVTAKGETIRVPRGFVCDEASDLLRRRGDQNIAAVLHDWLYAQGTRPKAECDALFREAMASLGVNPVTRWTFYLGVKLFGGRAWQKHRDEDATAGKKAA